MDNKTYFRGRSKPTYHVLSPIVYIVIALVAFFVVRGMVEAHNELYQAQREYKLTQEQ